MKRVTPVVAALSIFGSLQADGQARTEQHALTSFANACGTERPYDVKFEATFASLERNPAASSGQWKYRYRRISRYELAASRGRLDFVSMMPAIGRQTRPKYIWHVLSVPSRPAPEEGNGPLPDLVAYAWKWRELDRDHDIWGADEHRQLAKSTSGDYLVYLVPGLEGWDRSGILEAWKKGFGRGPTEGLVLPSRAEGSAYKHTFIPQGVLGADRSINPDGDRRDSNKEVSLPGQAYGFVLDPAGVCLAVASVEIVNASE